MITLASHLAEQELLKIPTENRILAINETIDRLIEFRNDQIEEINLELIFKTNCAAVKTC